MTDTGPQRRTAGVRVCIAALLLASACGGAPPPNVVLISIDSLRPDHLGAYGYERAGISPNIDGLAAEGIVFERPVSTTTWTLPAHASMLTGLYPAVHGVHSDGDRLPEAAVLVSEALETAGYATRAVVSAPYLNAAFGFDQGWDLYDDAAGVFENRPANADDSHWGATSPEVHRRAVEALDAVGEGPFFLFVHYWDVHYDYAPPSPYDTMFDPDYEGTVTSLNFHWNDEIHRGMAPRDLRHIVALYDGEIAYTDSYLGLLFDELRARGVWDDTLVVLTADHGDEFFEHGAIGHRRTLFEEVVRVPLVLRLPGIVPAGRRVEAAVSLVDVLPSVLDLLGVANRPVLSSASLVPLWERGHGELSDDPQPRGVMTRLVRTAPVNVALRAGSEIAVPADLMTVTEGYLVDPVKILRERRWLRLPADLPPKSRESLRARSAELFAEETLRWIDLDAHPDEREEQYSDSFESPEARRALRLFREDVLRLTVARAGAAASAVDESLRSALEGLGYAGGATAEAPVTSDELILPLPGEGILD